MVTIDAKTVAKQDDFVCGCRTQIIFRLADPTMEDYDTPDDFEVEINTATSKRKVPEMDKRKKPKWKSGKTETFINELEKGSYP